MFGAAHDKDDQPDNPFTERLSDSEDRRHGMNERYYNDTTGGCHPLGPYQLDASDVASESSYGTLSSFVRRSNDEAITGLSCDGDIMGDNSFDALESYIGTEDEDDCSLLESVSNASEQEVRTQYKFAMQAPSPPCVTAAPVTTPSQRRTAAEACRKSQIHNPSSSAVNFHSSLPFRSYRSKATTCQTAGPQENSDRDRAKSLTSIIASGRLDMETMRLSSIPGSGRIYSSPNHNGKEGYMRDNSHKKILEQVDQHRVSISQRSSSASTLAAFPIPPMDNPVGELPMLVSRATSSPQALHIAPFQHPIATASLEDTYRAITKVNLGALLQRTRTKGERLQTVEWDKLTSFECAWREMNEALLVTIYGRADVVLDESDITYIDCVARELRNGSDRSTTSDWIRRIFETDF